MSNFKRFLAMALTMLMVASSFAMVASVSAFDDVTDYAEEIDTLYALGVIKGYDDKKFGPDDDVLRWQFALMLSKLMTGKTETDVWYSTSNYTDFTDINVDQYYGSIAYAANNGVVMGTSATTFDPTANIMYQDALTMAARALGYTITAAEYPYKAIDVAYKLGLDEGIEVTDYTETLTRGETAKLLANLLTAENTDGESFAETSFNLKEKNVIIVATDDTQAHDTSIEGSESLTRKGWVAFAELYENGQYNKSAIYHLPETAFGITGDSDQYIGTSFRVTTLDDFQSLLTCEMNGREVVDQTVFKAQADGNGFVNIKGTTYRLRSAAQGFSSLKNNQGVILSTQPEIMVWTTNIDYLDGDAAFQGDAIKTTNGQLSTDIYGNYYDANGNIVIYYVPGSIYTYGSNYLVKVDDGVYRAAGDADFAKVATITNNYASVINVANAATLWAKVANHNALANAIIFDDDNDGDYDRAIYQYYKFGKYTVNSSGKACIDNTVLHAQNSARATSTSTQAAPSNIKFLDAEGKTTTAPTSGSYILYAYNARSGIMTIKQTFTAETGLLTAYDQASKTVVIGGVTYALGVDGMPGATFMTDPAVGDYYDAGSVTKPYVPSHENKYIGDPASMMGQQVYFMVYEGKIIALYNSTASATPIVFESITGITTAGYVTAKVYTPAGASIVTIATINGYSYYQYYYPTLMDINSLLVKGELYLATVDAAGNYHITTVSEATTTLYNKGNADQTITFNNGISSANRVLYNKNGVAGMAAMEATTTTVFAWYNPQTQQFYVQTGLPTNGTTLTVNADAKISYQLKSGKLAFVYITAGAANGMFSAVDFRQYATNNTTSTIVYIDKDATQVITDQITGGALLGNTYTIVNALDVVNGGLVSVYTTAYNAQFEYGAFYTVNSGWLGQKVDLTAANSPIKVGTLTGISKYSSTINDTLRDHATPIIYVLDVAGTATTPNTLGNNILSQYDVAKLDAVGTNLNPLVINGKTIPAFTNKGADADLSTNVTPYNWASQIGTTNKWSVVGDTKTYSAEEIFEGATVYYYEPQGITGASNITNVYIYASNLTAAPAYAVSVHNNAVTVANAPQGSYVTINGVTKNLIADKTDAFAATIVAGDLVTVYNVAGEVIYNAPIAAAAITSITPVAAATVAANAATAKASVEALYSTSNTAGATIATPADYFVKVATVDNVAVTKLVAGGTEYAADTKVKVSVGNNAFVEDVAFKVVDGDVYVAATVLAFEGTNVAIANGAITISGATAGNAAPVAVKWSDGTAITATAGKYAIDYTTGFSKYIFFEIDGATADSKFVTKKVYPDGTANYGVTPADALAGAYGVGFYATDNFEAAEIQGKEIVYTIAGLAPITIAVNAATEA